MDLSTILLLCAIAAGVSGGVAARFRRWGTAPTDLFVGTSVTALFSVVVIVVLTLAVGLNLMGIIHYLYLLLVVGFPAGVALIVIPQFLDAERRMPIVGWLLAILAVSAGVIGLWATHVEPFRLQVDEQVLGATGANTPIVVGVIADLQTRSIGSHENAALDAILDADPDLVVLPGDLFELELDELDERLPEFLGWLRRLTDSVEHVVLVNGDVDFIDVVEDLAEEAGAVFLNDALITLPVNGQDVTLAGLTVNPDEEMSAINPRVIESLESTTNINDLVIAVSHFPDPVLTLPALTTVDLMVSGHTHGGQVSLPGFGPPLTFSGVPKVVAAGGLHVVDGTPIYVSTGVGIARGQAPQLRFAVPPSVGLITIVPPE